MAVTNSTVTSVSTSTVTQVSTIHQTSTVTQGPLLIFGLPPELLAFGLIAIAAVVYLVFRFQVRTIPVGLLLILKNYSAIMLRVGEDFQGIFLRVYRGGKEIGTIKQTGLPLQVRYIPDKFQAYIDPPKDEGKEKEVVAYLKEKGFKVTPAKYNRKGQIKAYLIEKEQIMKSAVAFLDVSLGGLKTMKLYAGVDGTGSTTDWKEKVDGAATVDPGNTAVVHEMRGAFKAILADIAAAMKGTFATFLVPLIAGIGVGGMIVALLFILSGHVK